MIENETERELECQKPLLVILYVLNGYHRTTSSTTYSSEVCKSLEEIYITFRLSRGCALGRD